MFYVLQFPSLNSLNYANRVIDRNGVISASPVMNWLVYGKLPENLNVTPAYAPQYFEANGANRYIYSVEVNPIAPATSTVTLAAGAVLTMTIKGMKTATSSDSAFATATVSGDTLTITGVAAGTATVEVKDGSNDTMVVFTVTVS